MTEQSPEFDKKHLLDSIRRAVNLASWLPSLHSIAHYSYRLPRDIDRLDPNGKVVDKTMLQTLEASSAINWCSSIQRVVPVQTMGDGNCLLHAISLYVWGVHDHGYFLRSLVCHALDNDDGQIEARWKHEQNIISGSIPGGVRLSEQQWQEDWSYVRKVVSGGGSAKAYTWGNVGYLEAVHIFVIANILQRPVVVYGERTLRGTAGTEISPNHIAGIYLPLLIEPTACIRSPILLAYNRSHFVPLMNLDDDDVGGNDGYLSQIRRSSRPSTTPNAVCAVPLVYATLEPMRARFVRAEDEARIMSYMQSYLQLLEVAHRPPGGGVGKQDILCTQLTYSKLPAKCRAPLPEEPPRPGAVAEADPPAAWPAEAPSGKAAGSHCQAPLCGFDACDETYPYCRGCHSGMLWQNYRRRSSDAPNKAPQSTGAGPDRSAAGAEPVKNNAGGVRRDGSSAGPASSATDTTACADISERLVELPPIGNGCRVTGEAHRRRSGGATAAPKCVHPRCWFAGCSAFGGLCEECYDVINRHKEHQARLLQKAQLEERAQSNNKSVDRKRSDTKRR